MISDYFKFQFRFPALQSSPKSPSIGKFINLVHAYQYGIDLDKTLKGHRMFLGPGQL